MEIATEKQHVERRPGVCGGKPCIAGTRIRVQDVYFWHEVQGQTPAQIVADFPHLTLADVHAALAYYFDHAAEIQQEIEEGRQFVEKMKAAAGPGLLDRLRKEQNGDSVSP